MSASGPAAFLGRLRHGAALAAMCCVALPPGWDIRSEGGVTILQRSGPLSTGSFAFLQTRDDGWTWAVAFNRMPDQADIATAVAELEAAVVGASAEQAAR